MNFHESIEPEWSVGQAMSVRQYCDYTLRQSQQEGVGTAMCEVIADTYRMQYRYWVPSEAHLPTYVFMESNFCTIRR